LPSMTFTGKEDSDLSGSNGAGDETAGLYADLKNLFALLSRTAVAGKIPIYDDDGNLVVASGIGVGEIGFFPCSSAPTNYLKANGALLNREDYSELWSFAKNSGNIVSDTDWSSSAMYGSFSYGDGSTTFRVPRLNGYFLRAYDEGQGIDADRVLGQYQESSNLSHRHKVYSSNHYSDYCHGFGREEAQYGFGGPKAGTLAWYDADYAGHQLLEDVGESEARPVNVALLACIRYQ